MSPARETAGGKAETPSRLSRNVAIASAASIALLVAYLSFEAWRDSAPAVITFEVVAAEGWSEGETAYVPVDVRNTGGQTAAQIEIETRFEIPGSEPLVKHTIIDFLAGGERRRFYVVGPPGTPPTTRVIGFQEP
jgi:uncharacterized protein (TIGR02588 family)